MSNQTGWYAICKACYHGHMDLVRYLLEEVGVDYQVISDVSLSLALNICTIADTMTNQDGYNLIGTACEKGRVEVVQYLCRRYPDLSVTKPNKVSINRQVS